MSIFKEQAFAGKVAFIAGASSGINLGIAQRFASLGAKVGLISRSRERICAAAQTILQSAGEAVGIEADVRDYAAVDHALATVRELYGEIDFVISGAAGNFLAPALGLSSNAFRTIIEIDLIGTFNVLRAAYAYLRKPGASIISITAPQAERPVVFQAHAGAAKAGINNLTRTLAMEWGPAGVRVNAISPGPIGDTEGIRRLVSSTELAKELKASIALRAYGSKQDVADTAVFLCSDNARYITGTIVDCDGGMILGDASADALSVPAKRAL